jgi:hypothetical protein
LASFEYFILVLCLILNMIMLLVDLLPLWQPFLLDQSIQWLHLPFIVAHLVSSYML